jgi:branched-chain amino acid transport system ATP-binding protein
MTLLELRDVSVGYAGAPVLRGIDLGLEEGEIVTLVGANGAGKSTLVKAISGLLRPIAGEVRFDGRVVNQHTPAERLRLGIAHIPEGRQIFSGMTVAENLLLGAYTNLDELSIIRRRAYVYELFPFLRDRQNDIAGNFSGGQQQMLAIARGLMSNPRVLVFDEPSLGLAPLLVAEIFRLIVRLRDEGIAVVLAEQNARQALAIADWGYVFENGAIKLTGSGSDLLASREIAKRYLGVGSATEAGAADSASMAQRLRDCVW